MTKQWNVFMMFSCVLMWLQIRFPDGNTSEMLSPVCKRSLMAFMFQEGGAAKEPQGTLAECWCEEHSQELT